MRPAIFFLILFLCSCDPKDFEKLIQNTQLSNADIAGGLKEALMLGTNDGVISLSTTNGYFNSPYKILLPEEAGKIIDKLKFIPGFSNLEQEAIKKINQAAEDAAKKAGPIFTAAIREMTFSDVMNVLMGEKNAATQYLHAKTYDQLYNQFQPVIVESLNKFGALDLWSKAITKYNALPFVEKLNPDLGDHVTHKALFGLFSLVEQKELAIRSDFRQRTSDLLRRVFAKQD